jgi:hypothetical protein
MATRAAECCGHTDGVGTALPSVWSARVSRSRFGDAAVLVFLVAQVLDGTLTYLGVVTFGIAREGNPLLAALMETFGHGPALVAAKVVASVLGIALHVARVHLAVALLSAFYVMAAVLPWTALLLLHV